MEVQKFYVSKKLSEMIKKRIDWKDDGHKNTTFSILDISLRELISALETEHLPLLLKHKNYNNTLINISDSLIWPDLFKIEHAFSFVSFSDIEVKNAKYPTKDELFSYLKYHPKVKHLDTNVNNVMFYFHCNQDNHWVKNIKIQAPHDYFPKYQMISDPSLPDLNLDLKCIKEEQSILQLIRDHVIYYEEAEQQAKFEKIISEILKKYDSTEIIHVSSEQQNSLSQLLLNLEHILTKDQPLVGQYLTNPQNSLWELALQYKKNPTDVLIQLNTPWQGTDPNQSHSINQDSKVVIDFGSSSTIVVVEEQGSPKLLQLSYQNEHDNFENPTFLSIHSYKNFEEAWFQYDHKVYLSSTRIASMDLKIDLKYAATVKNQLNDSFKKQGEEEQNAILRYVRASMSMFKQWAMEEQKQNSHKYYSDEQDNNKTLFQAKILSDQDAKQLKKNIVDPIELYSYIIGSFINSRRSKIHQEYYMTFPVKYNNEAKNKILASFKRGLKKSLPSAFDGDIHVTQIASEPSAIIAKAFKLLKIKPEKEGIPYAVFDFGGGTADFSYGIYRKANHDIEIEDTYHRVIEQYGRGGDQYLGGENILNELADMIFIEDDNLKKFQKENIVFERPLNVQKINVPAHLIDPNDPYARINRSILISAFEWIWKDLKIPADFEKTGFKINTTNTCTIKLYASTKEKENIVVVPKEIVLKIDTPKIVQMIKQKIVNGFINFFKTMQKAFEGKALPENKKLSIILAGNSCKSLHVREFINDFFPPMQLDGDSVNQYYQKLLTILDHDKAFLDSIWSYLHNSEIRTDLLDGIYDENYNIKINGKTVLATGLLDLCPGGTTLLIEEESETKLNSLYALGAWDDDDVFDVRLSLSATINKIANASNLSPIYMGTANAGVFNLVYSNIAGNHSRAMLKQKVWQSRIQFQQSQYKHVWMIPISKDSYALFNLDTKEFNPVYFQDVYQNHLAIKYIKMIEIEVQIQDISYADLLSIK